MSRRPAARATGFTLTELCIVLAMLALLLGGVLPALRQKVQAQSARQRCHSHLREIGQGIQMYANENKGSFPRAVFQAAPQPRYSVYSNPTAPSPFAPNSVAPNDVTAALFLILRTQDVTSGTFICPEAEVGEAWDFGGKRAVDVSNFPSRQYLSYSYVNPYPSQEALQSGFKLNYTLTSDFAVAADMNSGAPGLATIKPDAAKAQMEAVNSPNHRGEGQNVLYADGHVEFQNTVFAGMQRPVAPRPYRDNIYTAGSMERPAPTPFAPAQDQMDSVLLPTVREGPAPSRDAPSPRDSAGSGPGGSGATAGGTSVAVGSVKPGWFWVLLVLGVLILLALVVLVLVVILRPGRAPAAAPVPGMTYGPMHPYAPQPYYGAPPQQPGTQPARRDPPPLP